MSLREKIEKYVPYDEQEERDKEQILKFMDTYSDVLTRDNVMGHFSASAFVVNKDRTKMVVVYHLIQDGWVAPGGHADGEEDLLKVALRECEEETGLKAKVLRDKPILISSNNVKPHIKRGKFVSSHLHFDFLYLMEADENIELTYREDESKGVKWISFDNIENENMVDFVKPIVLKLIKKVKSTKL